MPTLVEQDERRDGHQLGRLRVPSEGTRPGTDRTKSSMGCEVGSRDGSSKGDPHPCVRGGAGKDSVRNQCTRAPPALLSALKVPCVDHTFKDSPHSVVHHERAPTQELVSGILTVQVAVQTAGTSKVVADAVTSVWVLAEHAFPRDVTAAEGIAHVGALPFLLWQCPAECLFRDPACFRVLSKCVFPYPVSWCHSGYISGVSLWVLSVYFQILLYVQVDLASRGPFSVSWCRLRSTENLNSGFCLRILFLRWVGQRIQFTRQSVEAWEQFPTFFT